MKNRIGILSLFVFCCMLLQAQDGLSIYLQKDSYLKISGSTNIISFELLQTGEPLINSCQNKILAIKNQNNILLSQNMLSLNVRDFISDNYFARRDFMYLLKSDIYPILKVKMDYITVSPNNIMAESTSGVSCVFITLMDITKEYCIPISTSCDGQIIVMRGEKMINIRDFGLEPPVQMLGLLRVSEMINVSFQFVTKIDK